MNLMNLSHKQDDLHVVAGNIRPLHNQEREIFYATLEHVNVDLGPAVNHVVVSPWQVLILDERP